jgi:hypothetical protein
MTAKDRLVLLGTLLSTALISLAAVQAGGSPVGWVAVILLAGVLYLVFSDLARQSRGR